MARMIELTHPGIMLKEDFLGEMDIRPSALAKGIGVDRAAISKILAGRRDITADMSLRLGLFFGQSDSFWLNLQRDYDLRVARRERLADHRKTIHPYEAHA